MEKVHAPQGRQCDGGQLEYDSLCCHNDEHNSGCTNSPCQNYVPGKLDPKRFSGTFVQNSEKF